MPLTHRGLGGRDLTTSAPMPPPARPPPIPTALPREHTQTSWITPEDPDRDVPAIDTALDFVPNLPLASLPEVNLLLPADNATVTQNLLHSVTVVQLDLDHFCIPSVCDPAT